MFSGISDFLSHELYFYIKRFGAKYYVIRRPELGAGFFSNYWWVMGHVVFANKLGYIPVVDMKNYRTLYSEDVPIDGELNAWNYYFEDVGGISIDDVYASNKFVLSEERPLNKYGNKYCDSVYRFPTKDTIKFYYPIVKKYMRIKKPLVEKFEKSWEKSVTKEDKVLGIHVRGTDMRNNLGHPVPAEISRYIEKTKIIISENREITKIFLASDEEDTITTFITELSEYPVHIFYNNAFRGGNEEIAGKKIGIHETKVVEARNLHKYRLGLEVLNDAYFLMKSDFLLCGYSNITNVAIIWNNDNYKDVFCISDGVA